MLCSLPSRRHQRGGQREKAAALPCKPNEVTRKTSDFYRRPSALAGGRGSVCRRRPRSERYTASPANQDLDVFNPPGTTASVSENFADAAIHRVTFSTGGQAYRDDDFIDAIFSSGNALAPWRRLVAHAVESEVFGEPSCSARRRR